MMRSYQHHDDEHYDHDHVIATDENNCWPHEEVIKGAMAKLVERSAPEAGWTGG